MNKTMLFICLNLLGLNVFAQTSTYSGRASSIAAVNLSITISGNFTVPGNTNTTTAIPSGITKNQANADVSYELYPNPTQSVFTLNLKTDKVATIRLSVYDISGKIIEQVENVELTTSKFTHVFNTTAYTPGNYILKISSKEGKIYKSISFTKE